MARFHGMIGYVETRETEPGVYSEVFIERDYYGDVIRNSRRWETGEHLNDNPVINNQFSIVADDFAYLNFQVMRYIKWMDVAWKITNIEVQRPRLILTVGSVYNVPEVPNES
jgi:hypothetical protein